MKNKLKNIELIVDKLKLLFETENKIIDIFGGDCECFVGIYEIAYEVVPDILGIEKQSEDEEKLAKLIHNYISGVILKEEFINEIKKYIKEEK